MLVSSQKMNKEIKWSANTTPSIEPMNAMRKP